MKHLSVSKYDRKEQLLFLFEFCHTKHFHITTVKTKNHSGSASLCLASWITTFFVRSLTIAILTNSSSSCLQGHRFVAQDEHGIGKSSGSKT